MQQYAKILSSTSITTAVPKSARIDGRLVIGRLPEPYLNSIGFYRFTPVPCPSEPPDTGRHWETRYSLDSNDSEVVQAWVQIEDPPAPPAVYSKLKILLAADQAGFAEELMDMIEADRKTKYIWDASNTIEDNELLAAYLPDVAQALGRTTAELKAFLDENCLAD